MEEVKTCERCRYFDTGMHGIVPADGYCLAVRKSPKPVRKWFKGSKFFTERKEDKHE